MTTDLDASLRELLGGRLQTAVDLAILAGNSTLDLFQSDALSVERKGDDSPVTQADRRAEQLIRDRLSESFPDDAILGEEFGEQTGTSQYQWVVDPIDGTKSFISGVPLYSTLIGLVQGRTCLAGVIYIPALREIVFAATGHGAWHSFQGSPWKRCQVSNRPLSSGSFLVSQVDSFDGRGAAAGFHGLESQAYVTRTWGDGYGYLLVATGRAELMVDPIANPWDLAAVQPIVDEAGGRFSSWQGESTVFGGDGVGSNGIVHDTALSILNGAS